MSTPQSAYPRKADSLLHTKLMPPRLPATVIPRDQLLSRLDMGLTKKVSLVTAPTGFGKTTLIRMWIASRDFRWAWVTLDENDNDSTRFWTYVVSALRAMDSAVGKNTLSALSMTCDVMLQKQRLRRNSLEWDWAGSIKCWSDGHSNTSC